MYPDAYEVGLPNQGVQILYEVLNERRRRPGRAHLRRVAGPGGADARARRARSSPSTRTARSARSTCSASRFATELGYTNMLTALDLAGIPLHARRPRRATHPIVLAGGHAAFNPEPVADFIDAAVLGDGEQAVLADHRRRPRAGRREGRPGGRDELLLRLAAHRRRLRARVLRRRLPRPTAGSSGSRPTGRACRGGSRKHTVMDLDAWPYPKQPLVPLAETVHERMSRRDLPRLHPRLPVLPGRHDHPPGARAVDHRRSARWSSTAWRRPASRRSGCSSLSSADHSEIGDDRPRAWPTATRAPTTSLSLPSHPGRRVQHRPGQRAVPQRPALRPDLRPRGRQRADAQGDQQDGHRGGPDPHRHHGVLRTAGGR